MIEFEHKYYLLTVKRAQFDDECHPETIFYVGNLIKFLIVERELGRMTRILFAQEISKREYEFAVTKIKHIENRKEGVQ